VFYYSVKLPQGSSIRLAGSDIPMTGTGSTCSTVPASANSFVGRDFPGDVGTRRSPIQLVTRLQAVIACH